MAQRVKVTTKTRTVRTMTHRNKKKKATLKKKR